MASDRSVGPIARWVREVPGGKWPRQDAALALLDDALPELVATSRPLREVHRLDLALFVVFEEAAARVSGCLVRHAPHGDALAFAAQQTLDEARHLELFRARLARCHGDVDVLGVLTPPLARFVERCHEVADGASFTDALVLMNLVLEGMAYPLYTYERRYWQRIDPHLAALVAAAYADETRHVTEGARLCASLLADGAERARVTRLCHDARRTLGEAFRYYVSRFVGLFDAVARQHGERFGAVEVAPGRPIATTPYADQVAIIHASIDREHTRLLARAGLV